MASKVNNKPRRSQRASHRQSAPSLRSVAEGDEDLANMDPAQLQMMLDDIETGWAFEPNNSATGNDMDHLLDRNGVDLAGKICVCEFDCSCAEPGVSNGPQSSGINGSPMQVQFTGNMPHSNHNNQGSDYNYTSGQDSTAEQENRSSTISGNNFSSSRSRSKASIAASAYYSTAGMTQATTMTGLFTMIPKRVSMMASFIFLMGLISMAVIFGLGLSSEAQNQIKDYEEIRDAILDQFEITIQQYLQTGLLLHQVTAQPTMNHESFSIFHDYVDATSPPSPARGIALYVDSREEKAQLENNTRTYLAKQYPDSSSFYNGVYGMPSPSHNLRNQFVIIPHELYYPLHYWEPLEDPEIRPLIDFDIYTLPPLKAAITKAVEFQEPALSPLLDLHSIHLTYPNNETTDRKDMEEEPWQDVNSVMLLHPGLSAVQNQRRKRNLAATSVNPSYDLSVVTIQIADLLEALNGLELDKEVSVYLYDSTDRIDDEDNDNNQQNGTMNFMGAAKILRFDTKTHTQPPPEYLSPPEDLEKMEESFEPFYNATQLQIATREWTLIVAIDEEELPFRPQFIFLAGYMIFFACCSVAVGMVSNQYRMARMNQERSAAEKDRMILKIKNARKQASQERALNDFLAHEVRNPLSAAISATSFVYAAIHDDNNGNSPDTLLSNEQKRKSVLDDVIIIDASLHFANDLLRNMLDMHRAATNQLNVDFTPVDLLHDVLEPVANMLYTRDAEYEVQIVCPLDGLIVMSDRLRLKQMVLNLARNSTKFVQKGFLRLKAEVGTDETVYLSIEDSGPGVPVEKQKALFQKFQESLDLLNQGTGIGLSLCKKIMSLLGGEIYLDENYDSGIEGCPGARFVISLMKRPLSDDVIADHTKTHLLKDGAVRSSLRSRTSGDSTGSISTEGTINMLSTFNLPESLSVLFVDDDAMLRKLFSRSLKRAMPGWRIREAANGETALRLVESEDFDLIFMDQYMSSTEKQLTGTETVRNLRAKGVMDSIVCGLSANDIELNFIKSGADSFLIKPLPCNEDELKAALVKLLKTRGGKYDQIPQEQAPVATWDIAEAAPLATPIASSGEERADNTQESVEVKAPLFSLAPALKNVTDVDEKTRAPPLFNISTPGNPSTATTEVPRPKPAPLFDLTTSDNPQPAKPTPLFNILSQESSKAPGNIPQRQKPAPLLTIAPQTTSAPLGDTPSSTNPPPLFKIAPNAAKSKPGTGKLAPLFDITPQSDKIASAKPAPLFSIAPQASVTPKESAASSQPAPLFDIAPKEPSEVQNDTGSAKPAPLFSIAPQTATVATTESAAASKPAPLFNIAQSMLSSPPPPSPLNFHGSYKEEKFKDEDELSCSARLNDSFTSEEGDKFQDEPPVMCHENGQQKPAPLFSINPPSAASSSDEDKPRAVAPLFQIKQASNPAHNPKEQ